MDITADPETVARRVGASRLGILAALWILYFVNYIDRVAISIAGPAMMETLSLSPASFGVILSSFGVGYFLAQIPGGLIADRWGSRIVLSICPLFWALFTGLTGFVHTIIAFILVRLCFGLTEGLAQGPTYKAIGDSFSSRQRARALAIVVSSATLAPAFAGALVGHLINQHGWRMMFALLALPALLAALASYLLLPVGRSGNGDAHAPAGEAKPTAFRDVIAHPALWFLSMSQFGYNFVTWGYSGWLPSYLSLARHIDLKSVGLLSSIPYVFGFLGLLAGGALGSSALHRFRPQLVAVCYLLAGLSLYIAYDAQTVATSVAGLSATSFFLYAGYGPKGAIMLDLAPDRFRAAYVGIVSTVGQAAAVVAPAAIGLLVSLSGSFAAGFGLMIVALFLSASSLLLVTAAWARTVQSPSRSE